MAGRAALKQSVFETEGPMRIDLNSQSKPGSKKHRPSESIIFGVKFCPFLPPEADPVFALTFESNILVYRIISSRNGEDIKFSIIRSIKETGEVNGVPQEQYCLAWMQDPQTGDALIIFSGHLLKIHVYNVATGKIVRTLVGHTGSVQELIPHPTLRGTFASCSADNQIRLWNLNSKFDDSFCSVICHGGFGHNSTVFSIDFTSNGRYLISGSRDTWHHLWALPSPDDLVELPKHKANSKRIYYPHFSSAEVRGDAIDCVRFYGDLILTRSVGHVVLLWKIDGFSSRALPPPPPPTKHDPKSMTRNAFGEGFVRLMAFEFDHESMPVYYFRFDVFTGITEDAVDPQHILAVGSVTKPVVKLWDLQRLTELEGDTGWDGGLFEHIQPHQELNPGLKEKAGVRAISWSVDGKWLVASCDGGLLLVWPRRQRVVDSDAEMEG